MKKIKSLVILFVILSMVIGLSELLRPNQNALSNALPLVMEKVSSSLEKQIRTMESPFYRNISVKLVPVKSNIQPNSLSYAIFNVNLQQVLKAQSPEELPMVKGMINCLNSKKPDLKKSQIDYANRELGAQIKELKGYINKTEELNTTFKVEYYVDANYNIRSGSIKFYVETPDGDAFLDADVLRPGTPEELEKYGFKRMEEIIKENKINNKLTISSFHDAYDRDAASNYADTYTSNPPDGEGNDQYDPQSGAWWDKTHWNTYEYPFSTSLYSDCTDYVSQALYAGGIPMDSIHDTSHWWCNRYSTTPPPDYAPWVWISPRGENNNTGLRNYMTSHNYFYNVSEYDYLNKGDVMIKKDDTHIVMITQSDTINYALSAHMTDRKHYWFSGSHLNPDGTTGSSHTPYYQNNYKFYVVHRIVEVGF